MSDKMKMKMMKMKMHMKWRWRWWRWRCIWSAAWPCCCTSTWPNNQRRLQKKKNNNKNTYLLLAFWPVGAAPPQVTRMSAISRNFLSSTWRRGRTVLCLFGFSRESETVSRLLGYIVVGINQHRYYITHATWSGLTHWRPEKTIRIEVRHST